MKTEDQRPLTAAPFDLASLASQFPHIGVLSEANDGEILEFFEQAEMSGGALRLSIKRKPSYFELFRQRGGTTRVLGMRDDAGALVGVSALTSTPCRIAGEPGHAVYLADLRIQTRSRELRAEWRGMFGSTLANGRHLADFGANARLLAVIIESNAKARRVFEDRVHNGQKLVRLCSYRMVTLLGRWPWAKLRRRPATRGAFRLERGVSAREFELFLHAVHERQAFGLNFLGEASELRHRLKTWPGFSLDDVLVVRDGTGRIRAATALWNPKQAKKAVVDGPWWVKPFNWLARPLGWPCFGRPLDILYCTHLAFAWDLKEDERRTALQLLIAHAWPEVKKRRAHGLAFCDFDECELASSLSGFVKAPVPVGLYMAVAEADAATFQRETLGLFPPAFELALV